MFLFAAGLGLLGFGAYEWHKHHQQMQVHTSTMNAQSSLAIDAQATGQPLPPAMATTVAQVQANGTDAQRLQVANYLRGIGYTYTAEFVLTRPGGAAVMKGWY